LLVELFESYGEARTCESEKYMESFIYPTDAQLDCSKTVKIYLKIYMREAPLM